MSSSATPRRIRAKPLEFQSPQTLIWGHEEFTTRIRDDGYWVLHGHTIVDEATAQDGRISIDTGAYATGRLTCAHVYNQGLTFMRPSDEK